MTSFLTCVKWCYLDIFVLCAAEGNCPLQGFASEGSHPRHIVKLEIAPGELQPSRKPQLQGFDVVLPLSNTSQDEVCSHKGSDMQVAVTVENNDWRA